MTLSRRRFLGLVGASVVAAAAEASPGGGIAPRGSPAGWREAPPLPWATQEAYAAACGGQIVVAGGLRSGPESSMRFETLSRTALFDPGTDAWSPGPDLPAPRHHIVLAEVEGVVYGFGGFVGESLRDGFRFRREVYALRDGGWAGAGRMPVPLGETVAARLGGRVHLATGSLHPPDGPARPATGRHVVYHPGDGEWSTARPAPTARSSAAGAEIDGLLYVAGGRRPGKGFQNVDALERYDPEADRWESLHPLPRPSGGLAAAALGGKLYCFGGERLGRGGGEVIGAAWMYDPVRDAWRELPPMPMPRHGLAAAAAGGRVYAIGGNTAPAVGGATSRRVEALSPPGDA